MGYVNVDNKKFKGFALKNNSEEDVGLIVRNESSFNDEFIMRSGQTFYALVGDVVEIAPLSWAKKSLFYIEESLAPNRYDLAERNRIVQRGNAQASIQKIIRLYPHFSKEEWELILTACKIEEEEEKTKNE